MELPLLQRREVEARVLAPIIAALSERFGREAVLETVAETVRGLAREHGRQLAVELGGNTIAELGRVLEKWREGGALEIDLLRHDDQHLHFDVTRCRFAEMYHRLGIPELGPVLSCNRDFCFAEGFNPELRLERTQTIMKGARCCDFRFEKPGS